MRIRVPERGYTDIDSQTWSVLQGSPDFLRLYAARIVEIAYRPNGQVRLKGTCYVGHAICGTVLIEFCEKVENSLSVLLEFASCETFKLAKAKSATSKIGGLAVLLASQYVDAVAAYASSGRKFEYGAINSTGPLAGGKLNMTKTIQLRAKGFGHLLAFQKNVSVFNTLANRVVLTALAEVEQLASFEIFPDHLIAKSRGLSMLFGDCRDHETLYRERSYFAKEASRLSQSPGDRVFQDMMALASVLLSHESFDSSSGRSTNLPRTWFLNLERLFETAVRNILIELCPGVSVRHGGKSPQAIFSAERQVYRANPDIVIKSTSKILGVGDVKYKIYDGSAGNSDVYQLLAHAEAFEANSAFLIFPGDSYSYRSLGESRGGIDVTFFSIRFGYLSEDIATLATHMGFSVNPGRSIS